MKSIYSTYTNWVGNVPVVHGIDFWVEWGPVIVITILWLILVTVMVLLVKSVGYRIGAKHLLLTVAGIPIRWVRLDNIRNIHTRRTRFAEKWHNKFFSKNDRILVIVKRRGLLKNIEMTPEQRYVFKAELDRAIRVVMGLPPAPTAAETTTFDRLAAQQKLTEESPAPQQK